MGGEKLSSGAYVAKDKGSPPRRRGKGVNVNCSADDIGITPAWAGKRSQVAAALQSGWDHPRIGGEKSGLHRKRPHQRGSPPHGRGKAAHPLLAECWHGDHPRVGGEKIKSGGPLDTARGSPPRGRGKGITARPKGLSGRITPAWAGKRLSILGLSKGGEDHPRVGGEKHLDVKDKPALIGSPPRGRGKALGCERQARTYRITPAWAGKRPGPRGAG